MRRAVRFAVCLAAVGVLGICLSSVKPVPVRAAAMKSAGYPASVCSAALPGGSSRRPAAPGMGVTHFDARAQARFEGRLMPDGTALFTTRSGQLVARKTVGPDGGVRIVLEAGDDRLEVSMQGYDVDITRGETSVHLDLANAEDSDFLKAKMLVAGSNALRLHRLLAISLDPRTLRTVSGMGTLLTDAFLGLLDGDVGAVDRLGERLAERRRAKIRRVSLEDPEAEKGCYEEYEAELFRAWDSYVNCKALTPYWNPFRELCTARYMLWAESAWFHFLSCCAIPIRTELLVP